MVDSPRDIAVGVLVDELGRVLVALRRAGTPGAGFWEFPGGKHELGETLFDCLQRELAEEIGVHEVQGRPLIRFAHSRGPTPVRLHVWRIERWLGQPQGREGQELAWRAPSALDVQRLLPATDVILNALRLPQRYLITPDAEPGQEASWSAGFERVLAGPLALLRLRRTDLDDAAYGALAADLVPRAHAAGKQLLLDRSADLAAATAADGLHWSIARLREHGRPRLAENQLFGVSAHDGEELDMAVRASADFATLSPVQATASHADRAPLGWPQWQALRADRAVPVYALGGVGDKDLETALSNDAQGIAAIRAFWPA